MLDYEKIGRRIQEQRKMLRKLSQEKMAEDLGMYQADISNLEKAKKGSGITNLGTLELIADYFSIPLSTLIFGEGEEMIKYYGNALQMKDFSGEIKKEHSETLQCLTGKPINKGSGCVFGPYTLYHFWEVQYIWGPNTTVENGVVKNPASQFPKLHTYVFYENEIAGVMMLGAADIMSHVYRPALQALQSFIPYQILDPIDVWRTLNPYGALWQFEEDEEKGNEYYETMYKRMDELRKYADMRVLYIESVYVREDYRQHGILRLYIDSLRKYIGDSVMWLNLEPTSGSELEDEYGYLPYYTIADLGQLSINAAIAEKIGFTIDPDTWHRRIETVTPDGKKETRVSLVRKCAYYLPECIRNIIKNDGDLVTLGRAKQAIYQEKDKDKEKDKYDIDQRVKKQDGFIIVEHKRSTISGPNIGDVKYFYAAKDTKGNYRIGISERSVINEGLSNNGELAVFESIEDAVNSLYEEDLILVFSFLQTLSFE